MASSCRQLHKIVRFLRKRHLHENCEHFHYLPSSRTNCQAENSIAVALYNYPNSQSTILDRTCDHSGLIFDLWSYVFLNFSDFRVGLTDPDRSVLQWKGKPREQCGTLLSYINKQKKNCLRSASASLQWCPWWWSWQFWMIHWARSSRSPAWVWPFFKFSHKTSLFWRTLRDHSSGCYFCRCYCRFANRPVEKLSVECI